MFRQALTKSSRVISSSSRSITQQPFVRSQFSPAPLSSLRATPAARTRWYSNSTETTKKEGEQSTQETEAKENQDADATSSAEAELKKKLEAKEKEAIDWKVRICTATLYYTRYMHKKFY